MHEWSYISKARDHGFARWPEKFRAGLHILVNRSIDTQHRFLWAAYMDVLPTAGKIIWLRFDFVFIPPLYHQVLKVYQRFPMCCRNARPVRLDALDSCGGQRCLVAGLPALLKPNTLSCQHTVPI